jgi:tetratricopeptide (TPR) repeat protein/predicted Ser/Thr protein kinase
MPEVGQMISHYKIVEKIGQGGMGEVYLADDFSLQRKVALKFLPPELGGNPSAHRRFIREAKSAAAIDHPYICHINEVGESEGIDFIVMEYVEGQTLQEKLQQGPLPLKEAQQIALEVVEALEEAHAKGIIHRDLKPANIMVTSKGHAKVMDFGLAKQAPDSGEIDLQDKTLSAITQSGAILGTPAYMSPEQFQGKPADSRSDLFSFGIVLYEMLTGIHPFRQLSMLETVSYTLTKPPHPLDLAKYQIPRDLKDILKKLLSKDPADRYQSAHELRPDLSNVFREERIGTAGLRFSRPIWIIIALVVFFLGIVPMTWWLWDYYFHSPLDALAFQERDWILIADFENLTGDEVFDRSLYTAVTVGIQQSKYVNVLPQTRIDEALQRMRRENTAKLDEAVACELAVREGIKAVLVFSIGEIGGVYSLTTRLVEPNKQTTVFSETATADGKDKVLSVLGRLIRTVRQSLGESMQSISSQSMPLPKVTTASLEALKIYADGKRLFLKDSETGTELIKQALEIDPDFAKAHATMGEYCYINNLRSKGEEHFLKALSLMDRLSTRERLWIQALIEDWRGNSDKAIERYKIYLAQYPDDSEGWFDLGWVYMARLNKHEKAIEAFKRALDINPSGAEFYLNIATCNLNLRRYEKAIEFYEKGFQLSPELITGEYLNDEYGFTLVRLGQFQKAKEVFNRMLTSESMAKRARGLRSIALLAMYHGKLLQAASNLKQSILINKSGGWRTSEYRDRMYLAMIYRLQGRTSDFTSELEAAKGTLSEAQFAPTWISILAKFYARIGKVKEASKLHAEMISQAENVTALSSINRSNQLDQAEIAMIEGEIDLAKGNTAEAIEFLESLLQWHSQNTNFLESLAFAHRKAGLLKEAASKYEEIISLFHLGKEAQESWIMAHYELGKIFRDMGNTEKAKEYYGKFLNIWKDADPDIPILKKAKAEYANL